MPRRSGWRTRRAGTPTWKTPIYWGVKLVETDQEMYGRSKNARTFVVISDGQVWSGNVQRAITAAGQRGVSVDVIGVGTSNGGMIPLPRDDKGVVLAGFEPIRSTIDRTSLREIARAGNGEYFEIDTAADEQIAARIIQNAARRSGNEQVDEAFDELYWYLLAAAAGCIALGVLFVKQRVQLGFGIAAALALLALDFEPAVVSDQDLEIVGDPENRSIRSFSYMWRITASPNSLQLHFLRAFHQSSEIVGHGLGRDRAFHAFDDQICGFRPPQVAEHHLA